MAKRALALMLTVVCLAPASAQRMTIAQLRQTLAGYVAERKSDESIAKKCEPIELAEQLTPATLSAMKEEFRLGPKTSLALEMMADLSGFLDPPADEIPLKDPPDNAEQKKMLIQAVQFAAKTMHQMPNFIATRTTTAYDNQPLLESAGGWIPAGAPLREEGTTKEQITYRSGDEVPLLDRSKDRSRREEQSTQSNLSTTGEFGPVLSLVLTDSLNGSIAWSHWENISGRLTAVYNFAVGEQASHYIVNFCWQMLTLETTIHMRADFDRFTTSCYHGEPGYRGSIAVDRESGAVMRITVEPVLPPAIALTQAAMSIKYGTEEIGGQNYICPQSGVAVSRVRYSADSERPSREILRINETAFTDYRRFGTTVTILPNSDVH